jgi:hypothetical protein
MPQLDLFTFKYQIIILILCFNILYFFIISNILLNIKIALNLRELVFSIINIIKHKIFLKEQNFYKINFLGNIYIK